jgi:hypothetical protein
MKKPKQLVIIGGGLSIKEGIELGLWEKIKGKFTIGINFSYKYFPDATFQCYLDKQVRRKNVKDFAEMPLVITKLQPIKHRPNESQINTKGQYTRDIKSGIYKGSLTGIYCVTLGIHLLEEGEIYLLGYDYGGIVKDKDKKKRPLTHFYQGEIEHRGIGRANYYNRKTRAEQDFGVYKEEKKVKIYNVSLKSNLTTFPKISYTEFFKKLTHAKYNQDELRQWVKSKLPIKPKKK